MLAYRRSASLRRRLSALQEREPSLHVNEPDRPGWVKVRHEQQFREIFDGEGGAREEFPLQAKMGRESGDTGGSTRGGSEVPVLESSDDGEGSDGEMERIPNRKRAKVNVGGRARRLTGWVRGKRAQRSGRDEQGIGSGDGEEVVAV